MNKKINSIEKGIILGLGMFVVATVCTNVVAFG